MRRKYILQVLVVAVLIGLGGYTYLGGWRGVNYETVTLEEPYTLVGIAYEGKYDNPQVERNFRAIKAYIEQGTLEGTFAVVYWKHPEDYDGLIDQMMGVLYPASQVPAELPQDLTARALPGHQVVRATLTSHVAVMPAPGKVRRRMHDFAQTQGLRLDSISYEKLIGDWHLEVEMPVIPNAQTP